MPFEDVACSHGFRTYPSPPLTKHSCHPRAPRRHPYDAGSAPVAPPAAVAHRPSGADSGEMQGHEQQTKGDEDTRAECGRDLRQVHDERDGERDDGKYGNHARSFRGDGPLRHRVPGPLLCQPPSYPRGLVNLTEDRPLRQRSEVQWGDPDFTVRVATTDDL